MLQRVMSRFSVVFFVSQNQKTLQGNPSLVCFRKLPVAKKLIDKGGREYQDFASRFFCLSDERSRRGTLQSFINFGYRKSLDERVGGV